MNAIDRQTIAEATRLTNQGRLEEATAMLLGTGGQAAPGSTASTAPPVARRAGGTLLRGLLDRVAKAPLARGLKGFKPGRQRPEPVPEGARFEERLFANAAGQRAYKLYVPSRSGSGPLPLVVMLHGCTQTPDDFAAGTGMNALADELKFLVAYPAQDASANPQRCWNWFKANDQQRDRGEPSLIAGITRQVMDEFATDRNRVYVAGLSAGGAAAAIMGAAYPDLYAAIGVHSGLACGAARDMPSAFAAMRQGSTSATNAPAGTPPVATIVFHGDRDGTVSAVNGDHVIAQSKASAQLHSSVSRGRSAGGVEYTRTVQADDTGLVVLEHWLLHGGGHAWSGGSAAGSYTDPRGPDASREMLRFFLQHRLGPARG